MNINDLRFIKTEKAIQDAYIALKQTSHSPIRVTKLCEAALINKSTFYSHYDTVEELHDRVCRNVIEKILSETPGIDYLLSNTKYYVQSIVSALNSQKELLDALFDRNTSKKMRMVEDCISRQHLQNQEFIGRDLGLAFAISGAAKILTAEQSKERIDMAAHLIQAILNAPVK